MGKMYDVCQERGRATGERCGPKLEHQRTAAREGSGCKGMRKGEVVGFRAWGQGV